MILSLVMTLALFVQPDLSKLGAISSDPPAITIFTGGKTQTVSFQSQTVKITRQAKLRLVGKSVARYTAVLRIGDHAVASLVASRSEPGHFASALEISESTTLVLVSSPDPLPLPKILSAATQHGASGVTLAFSSLSPRSIRVVLEE